MPDRDTLGDPDPSKWEMGLDGKPADPWRHFIYLVLQRGDTAELFTYTTCSVTGRRAIGNLLRHYDRMQRTHPDMYPVVRLKVGGFNHRDERVGWVASAGVRRRRPAAERQRGQAGQLACGRLQRRDSVLKYPGHRANAVPLSLVVP